MHRYLYMVTVLAAWGLAGIAPAVDWPEEGLRLRVVGPDEAPLPEARFTLIPIPFYLEERVPGHVFLGQLTDEEGMVVLKPKEPLLGERPWAIQISSARTGARVIAGVNGEVIGRPGMIGGRASRYGCVRDESGRPVAGVTVTPIISPMGLVGPVPASASVVVSDAKGRFKVGDYPVDGRGEGLVFYKEGVGIYFWPEPISENGYGASRFLAEGCTAPLPRIMGIAAAEHVWPPVIDDMEIDIVLKKAASLEGVVVDLNTGEPVANTTVKTAVPGYFGFPVQSTVTDAQGRYRFLNTCMGLEHRVSAEPEGSLGEIWDVPMPEGQDIVEVEPLHVGSFSTISGQILEKDAARYLPEREVEFWVVKEDGNPTPDQVVIDDDGTFTIQTTPGMSSLFARGINCTVCKEGHVHRLILGRGEAREGLRIFTRPWDVLKGRVLLPDGSPAAGASVVANWGGKEYGPSETDAAGLFGIALPEQCFEVQGGCSGGIRFSARIDGGEPLYAVKEVDRMPADSAFCEIQSYECATVTGRVTSTGGEPKAGVAVRCEYVEPGRAGRRCGVRGASAETDDQGVFTMERVPAGVVVMTEVWSRETMMTGGASEPTVLKAGETRELPVITWRDPPETEVY